MAGDPSSRISPTAHYTSYVWFKHGLSHQALATRLGAGLWRTLRPMNLWYERFSERPSLDMSLLARHRVLDHLLERAIVSGEVRQVIEVAAGLSPRGYHFARRHRGIGLRYVEADLPDMAAHKRRLLEGAGLLGEDHRVVVIDALAEDGPSSLAGVAGVHLDPDRGTAIITEGLLGYFDEVAVRGMWKRFARCLRGFPGGLYLSDLNLSGDMAAMRGARIFKFLLETFARGKTHLHFEHPTDAERALRECGFGEARVHDPDEFAAMVDVPGVGRRHLVRLIEARA